MTQFTLSGQPKETESTDMALFVETSSHDVLKWNREKIAEALVKETNINPDLAKIIAIEVENMIKISKINEITAPLVRELTNAKLVEYGFEDFRKQHTRLGYPIFDVEQIICVPNKENANVPHGPEATNMTLASGIKKEYALTKVFTSEVTKAHVSGEIHMHDLGFIDRPYCSGQNLAYVAKYGLTLPNSISNAKPAKHAEILLAHLVKFSAALQCTFAGAIGWDAINIFMAPYLKGLDDKRLNQLAQVLLFEFSQQAVARGGQSIFSDLNFYWEIPKHFAKTEAIGPGGVMTGNTYSDYIEDAQRFAKAVFSVYKSGDAMGRPFFFPKPEVHMTEKFFKTEGHDEFLTQISDVAAEKGNTYFVFDRGETAKISECCRLAFKLRQSDFDDAASPWKMRFSALQNVTINLPRLAFEADRDDTILFELISKRLEIMAKSHLQKKKFIEKLVNLENRGPLNILSMRFDGENYLRMHRVTYLIGMLGLNELVQYHCGEELHSSTKALKFGLKVIAYMKKECERLGKKYDINLVLEQTPAESTAYRLAKLDLRNYPIQATQVVKGNISKNEVYYTNSTYLNVSKSMNPLDRVKQEGLFHPMIEAGSLSHVWLGETRPSAESIANMVKKIHTNTLNDQVAFSPEFTQCIDCQRMERGMSSTCSRCGSKNTDGITKVTGTYSTASSLNKGKIAESRDREQNKEFFK